MIQGNFCNLLKCNFKVDLNLELEIEKMMEENKYLFGEKAV